MGNNLSKLEVILGLRTEGSGRAKNDIKGLIDPVQKLNAEEKKRLATLKKIHAYEKKVFGMIKESTQKETQRRKATFDLINKQNGAQKILNQVEAESIVKKKQGADVMRRMNSLHEKQQKNLENINKKIEAQSVRFQGLSSALQKVKGALLGMGLGMMFTGMAIKNFFMGIARSMINTYMLVQGNNGAFSRSVSRLQGAWAFLKYSIMDALQQTGVLDWVINKITTLTDYLKTMSEEDLAKLGKAIITMVAFGAVMMFLGQVVLAFLIPLAALELGIILLNSAFVIWVASAISGAITWGATWIGVLIEMAIVFAPVIAAWVAVGLLIAAAIALIIIIGITWKEILTGWKLKLEWLWSFMAEFLIFMGIRWKQLGINLKLIALVIYKGFIEGFIDPLRSAFIDVVNLIINKFNDLLRLAQSSRFAPQWLKDMEEVAPLAAAVKIDMTETDKKIQDLNQEWSDWDIATNNNQLDKQQERQRLLSLMAENEQNAKEKISSAWDSAKGYVTGQQDDVNTAAGIDSQTQPGEGGENNTNSKNKTVNIYQTYDTSNADAMSNIGNNGEAIYAQLEELGFTRDGSTGG